MLAEQKPTQQTYQSLSTQIQFELQAAITDRNETKADCNLLSANLYALNDVDYIMSRIKVIKNTRKMLARTESQIERLRQRLVECSEEENLTRRREIRGLWE